MQHLPFPCLSHFLEKGGRSLLFPIFLSFTLGRSNFTAGTASSFLPPFSQSHKGQLQQQMESLPVGCGGLRSNSWALLFLLRQRLTARPLFQDSAPSRVLNFFLNIYPFCSHILRIATLICCSLLLVFTDFLINPKYFCSHAHALQYFFSDS